MRITRITLLSIIICIPFYVISQERCVKGYIYERITSVPVMGAHIYDQKNNLGAVTDSLGYFEICGSINETSSFKVSHTIYSPVEFSADKNNNSSLIIYVDEKVNEFNEITVTASSLPNRIMPGNQRIDQSQILSMPTFLGEADVIKSLQQITGIQSVSEGISGVFVRGGGAGHNLFLLDNMELMNPMHVMGIYSVFNPLITEKVDVYKGNTPVNFRSRIASCITVSSKDALNSPSQIETSIGNISSNITLTQKSSDNKIGITSGLRRSYLEVIKGISSLFIKDDDNYFKTTYYSFYDFNGRVTIKTGNRSSLILGWYSGSDNFKFNKTDYDAHTNYGNRSAIAEYKTLFRNNISLSSSLNYTRAWSDFEGNLIESYVEMSSQFEQYSVKTSLLFEHDKHLFRSGVDGYLYITKPQKLFAVIANDTISQSDKFRNADFSIFVEDTYSLSEKWSLYAGIRAYWYFNLGPYTDSDNNKTYRTNEIVSVIHPLVPSLSVSYSPRDKNSYSVAYSYNAQMLHLASISSIPLPNDIWSMSSNKIKPERAHQLSFAWRHKLPFGFFTAEAYGKLLNNQLIFNVNTDQSEEIAFDDHFYVGKGRAYGLELSVEKKTGKLTGAVNYTLSRSKRSFPEIFDGVWFNDKFDRIHDLSVTGTYKINKKWDIGANWVFAAGNCMTLAAGRFWMMGSIMNDYDGYNNFRMPSYHRLDISATLKLKTKIFKESLLNFSVTNIYNRSNPYFIYYMIYTGNSLYNIDIKAKQISLFPIMPSINWRIKF